MEKKEVSMTELFFDLTFVYILSTINITIQDVSSDLISFEGLGKSFMLFLVFFSIWVYRTLLVNRLFNKQWFQYGFVFLDMFIIIILSKFINADFQKTFQSFVLMSAIVYLSLGGQYWINYKFSKTKISIDLLVVYTTGLLITVIISIISLFLNAPFNFWLYFIGILIAVIFPLFFYKSSYKNPIFLNHLTERLSLLIILLFGEGLVLLIEGTKIKDFNILSIVYFIFITFIFIIYILHYKYTDKAIKNRTGFTTMYIHLFLLFSLDTIFLIINKSVLNNDLSIKEVYGLFIFFIIFIGCLLFNIKKHKKLS